MEAFEQVKAHATQHQAWDQRCYNQRARVVPLLPGERVLVRNFRRRAAGKLAPRWVPIPHVVLGQPCLDEPVYLVRPEGQSGPGRTLHHNNLRPCLAGVPPQQEGLREETPQVCANPGTQHLPFLPQEGHGPYREIGWLQAASDGEPNSSPVVPAVEAELGEPAEGGWQRPGQVEDEQPLLEVLPEEAEAGFHGEA